VKERETLKKKLRSA